MKSCPDCGVPPGTPHMDGCDVERCSVCGQQRLGACCAGHNKQDARWTGEWPGVVECRERGWFCRMVDGRWRPCDSTDDGATEDLNRWGYFQQSGEDGFYK